MKSKTSRNQGVGDTPKQRFWSRVSIPSTNAECYLWCGCVTSAGYGSVKVEGKETLAHRAAWFYTYGVMPSLCLLHSCDRPTCVNVHHLREGTAQDNADDRTKRNRFRPLAGEANGFAKLNNEKVLLIRQQFASGSVTQQELAILHQVSQTTIYKIVTRNSWTHI